MNKFVRCNDNEDAKLTICKEYEILEDYKSLFLVLNDDNLKAYYNRSRFTLPYTKNESMKTELTVQVDKVREAANKCPEAKEVLKTLFPDVFSKEVSKTELQKILDSATAIDIRRSYEYQNRALYLTSDYNWELLKDTQGEYCLIPTKK